MTPGELEAHYRDYISCLNERRLDRMNEFYADELLYNGRRLTRAQWLAQAIDATFDAMPDFQPGPTSPRIHGGGRRASASTCSTASGTASPTRCGRSRTSRRSGRRSRSDAGRAWAAFWLGLLPDLAVGQLGDHVEMPEVAGVLLHQVEQHAFEGRGVGTFPTRSWPSRLGQVMSHDDGPAALALSSQRGHQLFQRLSFGDVPPVAAPVAPRVGDRATFEAPLEPAQLDIREVLEQLQRRPPRRQRTLSLRGLGQPLDLADDAGSEVVQVSEEHVGAGRNGTCRFGERLTHEGDYRRTTPWWPCPRTPAPRSDIR